MPLHMASKASGDMGLVVEKSTTPVMPHKSRWLLSSQADFKTTVSRAGASALHWDEIRSVLRRDRTE